MCTPNCSLGQFISGSPQACTLCDPNCRSCNALATNCTSCGLDTILQQQQYLTATRTCSLTCLSSYYIFAANSIYECDKCDPACLVCSAPMSPSACKTCNNDAGFVLAFGSTTTCTSGCTPAQFISGTPLACTPCDLNCLSCDALANNCTSCGLDTNGKQMYLLSMGTYYQCSVLCPISYYVYTVGNKYECDKCDPACTHCSAPADSSSCSSCNNDAGYYFSLGSTSNCILGCPGG